MFRRDSRFFVSPAAAFFLALFAAASVLQAQTSSKPVQFLPHPKLEVVLDDFPASGLILDIGGGGEGVIAQLKGNQVIAVDLQKRELEEAPGEPLLKIVMDARDLKFLDRSFSTAAVFFTFMYIPPADHDKVFSEIHRVLKTGGRLLIWDVVFPAKTNPPQTAIMYPIHIKLPKTEIETGYGARFVEGQGMAHFVEAARRTGFDVVTQKSGQGWFRIELKKAD